MEVQLHSDVSTKAFIILVDIFADHLSGFATTLKQLDVLLNQAKELRNENLMKMVLLGLNVPYFKYLCQKTFLITCLVLHGKNKCLLLHQSSHSLSIKLFFSSQLAFSITDKDEISYFCIIYIIIFVSFIICIIIFVSISCCNFPTQYCYIK